MNFVVVLQAARYTYLYLRIVTQSTQPCVVAVTSQCDWWWSRPNSAAHTILLLSHKWRRTNKKTTQKTSSSNHIKSMFWWTRCVWSSTSPGNERVMAIVIMKIIIIYTLLRIRVSFLLEIRKTASVSVGADQKKCMQTGQVLRHSPISP